MKTTTRDNILHMAIALGIVGVLGIVFWYQESHGLPIRFPVTERQATFFITTAVVFGYTIQSRRKAWHSTRFWIVLSLLFSIYIPLQLLLIRSIGTQVGTVAAITSIEGLLLFIILERLVPRRHIGDSSRNHPSPLG